MSEAGMSEYRGPGAATSGAARPRRAAHGGASALTEAVAGSGPGGERAGFIDAGGIEAWAQAFLPGAGWRGPLRWVEARGASGEPLALAGFASQRVAGCSVPALGGYYWPWRGVALRRGVPRQVAADALSARLADAGIGPVLRMGPLSQGDADTAALLEALRRRGWRGLQRDMGCTFELRLPNTVEALHAGVSASLLKNLAYLRRRLEKQHGPVRIERHVLQGPDVQALLSRVARIERASWVAAEGGDAKFVEPAHLAFWSALARAPDRGAETVAWILSCRDTDLAFSFHAEAGPTLCILANSFDQAWRPHSPGSLLSLEVLQDAVLRGRRLVDWGQGDSGYKSRWGAEPGAGIFDLLLFRPGWGGAALHRAAGRMLRGWGGL